MPCVSDPTSDSYGSSDTLWTGTVGFDLDAEAEVGRFTSNLTPVYRIYRIE